MLDKTFENFLDKAFEDVTDAITITDNPNNLAKVLFNLLSQESYKDNVTDEVTAKKLYNNPDLMKEFSLVVATLLNRRREFLKEAGKEENLHKDINVTIDDLLKNNKDKDLKDWISRIREDIISVEIFNEAIDSFYNHKVNEDFKVLLKEEPNSVDRKELVASIIAHSVSEIADPITKDSVLDNEQLIRLLSSSLDIRKPKK